MNQKTVINIVARSVEQSKEEVIAGGEKAKDIKLNPIQKEILFLYTASLTLDKILDDFEIDLDEKYIVKFYDRISVNLEKMCSYENYVL